MEKLLTRAYHLTYYKKLWGDRKKLTAKNFVALPVSDKNLFRPAEVKKSLTAGESRIAYCYFSSGTTGNPKMIPFTNKEWVERTAYRRDCYKLAGVTEKNRVAILLPFGPWIAGPSAQSALMALGCRVFLLGDLSREEEKTRGLFKIIRKHHIDTIVTVPSFLQRFLSLCKQEQQRISLQRIITSGEYLPEILRKNAQSVFGSRVYSSYGTSESFIGIECNAHNGFHYNPGEVYIETVDEKTKHITEGVGLVVITVILSSTMPIVRYNLGDLGVIKNERCSCGVAWPRIEWRGRQHETFAVAGAVNVYSYQIHMALAKSELPIHRCEIEIFDNRKGSDFLNFTIFTSVAKNLWPKRINKRLREFLENMSMDFKDVVYHKTVKLMVDLRFDKVSQRRVKKTISVNDQRAYAR